MEPLRQGRIRKTEMTNVSFLYGARLFPVILAVLPSVVRLLGTRLFALRLPAVRLLVGSMKGVFEGRGHLGAARPRGAGRNRQRNVQTIRLRKIKPGMEFQTDVADQTRVGKRKLVADDVAASRVFSGREPFGNDLFAVEKDPPIRYGRNLLRHDKIERPNRNVLDVVHKGLNRFGRTAFQLHRKGRVDRDLSGIMGDQSGRKDGRAFVGRCWTPNLIDKRRLFAAGKFDRRAAAGAQLQRQPFHAAGKRNQLDIVVGNDGQDRRVDPVGRKFGEFEFGQSLSDVRRADQFPREDEISLDLFFQGEGRHSLGVGGNPDVVDTAFAVRSAEVPIHIVHPNRTQGGAVGGIGDARFQAYLTLADLNLVFRPGDQARLPGNRDRLE